MEVCNPTMTGKDAYKILVEGTRTLSAALQPSGDKFNMVEFVLAIHHCKQELWDERNKANQDAMELAAVGFTYFQ